MRSDIVRITQWYGHFAAIFYFAICHAPLFFALLLRRHAAYMVLIIFITGAIFAFTFFLMPLLPGRRSLPRYYATFFFHIQHSIYEASITQVI